jgi:AcrR family transcriptional regulator
MTKKEQVKEKIGAAAMQCFAKFGLEKTTLDDIGRVVNLNKASLYYYYKNKEDIFLDVALKEGEQYIAGLQAKARQKKGMETQVLFYLQERIKYYMLVLSRNKVRTESLHRLLPRFFVMYDDVMKQEIAFIALLLKEGIKNETYGKIDVNRLAASLITMSDALKHQVEQQALLQQEDDLDYASAIDHLKFLLGLIFKGMKQ